jgi:hypothetical protein
MRRLLLVLILTGLTGCSLDNLPTPRATYRPVIDAALYARIGQVPGVTDVRVRWTNGFDFPNGYRGIIAVRRGGDAADVLDRVLAILRQGRAGAALDGIKVAATGTVGVFAEDFGLVTQADFTARYGPQPGTGVPPPTPLQRRR